MRYNLPGGGAAASEVSLSKRAQTELRCLMVVLGLLPVAAGLVRAESASRPATTGATQGHPAKTPSSRPGDFDPSTPKGALKSLAVALDAGDRQAILARFAADDDAQRRWAEATASLAESAAVLRRAATAKFGPEASRALGVDPSAGAQALARIDAADAHIDSGRATLRSSHDDGPPLVLVLRDGAWRVPVSEFSRGVQPIDLERTTDSLASDARHLRELAAEVEAGTYPTAADARQKLDQRILQAAMPRPAVTLPAAPPP
jgi:hypothetical protein